MNGVLDKFISDARNPLVFNFARKTGPKPNLLRVLADRRVDDSDLLCDVAAAPEHPRLGLIGPVPLRRTGRHTSQGIAYLAAPGLEPGDRGLHSSSDVAPPAIAQLLGIESSTRMAGKSLFSAPVHAGHYAAPSVSRMNLNLLIPAITSISSKRSRLVKTGAHYVAVTEGSDRPLVGQLIRKSH